MKKKKKYKILEGQVFREIFEWHKVINIHYNVKMDFLNNVKYRISNEFVMDILDGYCEEVPKY